LVTHLAILPPPATRRSLAEGRHLKVGSERYPKIRKEGTMAGVWSCGIVADLIHDGPPARNFSTA
jgi:hypothetical protein